MWSGCRLRSALACARCVCCCWLAGRPASHRSPCQLGSLALTENNVSAECYPHRTSRLLPCVCMPGCRPSQYCPVKEWSSLNATRDGRPGHSPFHFLPFAPCLQAAQLKSFKPASGKQFVALLVPPRPPEQG